MSTFITSLHPVEIAWDRLMDVLDAAIKAYGGGEFRSDYAKQCYYVGGSLCIDSSTDVEDFCTVLNLDQMGNADFSQDDCYFEIPDDIFEKVKELYVMVKGKTNHYMKEVHDVYDHSYFDGIDKESIKMMLASHEQRGTLKEFLEEVAPDYVGVDMVWKFKLMEDLSLEAG